MSGADAVRESAGASPASAGAWRGVAAAGALFIALASLASLATAARAADGVVSRRDIEAALASSAAVGPQGATRSLAPATRGIAPDEPRTRGIVIKAAAEERREVIDLNIPFELDSAVLRPQAVAQLEQLDGALKSASLGQSRFLIAGHTDASGDAAYNRRLSLRRAEAVRDWLVGHGVDAHRLDTDGYGKERPLTPQDPMNPANRRVEIRRLAP